MRTGTSVVSAVTGPQTLFNERIQLKEGDAMGYGFSVPSNRKIEVSVDAKPKAVNVMLMTEEQWGKYNQVRGKLFGGQFQYLRSLSKESVLTMREADVVPAGKYRVVVEMPKESLVFADLTAAQVSILAY